MDFLKLSAILTLDKSDYENGLKDASGMASKVSGGLATAGKVAGVALTAATGAAVAFSKSAVSAGADFDKSMSQVAATMGVTTDEIGQLRDFAMKMGSTTAFSATEAADALNYMALAGYDAETSMKMLPNVLNLAAAGGMDLATASDMVTDAQTALGISLEDTTVMVDQMAKVSSTTNTSVAQLGEAILTIGGTAQYMSGGTEELTAVLGVLADNGIKGSEAGTHLRNMLLKLSAPTEDGAAALESLNIQVFDAEGNMRSFADIFSDLQNNMNDVTPVIQGAYNELAKMSQAELTQGIKDGTIDITKLGVELVNSEGKLREWNDVMKDINQTFIDGAMTDQMKIQTLSEIFNARDVAAAQALMSTTTERWEEIGFAIENADGAAEKMANTQLDNLAGDITLFKSALEGAKITLSDQLTPTLRQFVQLGASGLSKVTTAFNTGGLSAAMEALGEWLSDAINMLVENIPAFVEAGAEIITGLVGGLSENMPAIIEAVMSIIETFVNVVVTNLPTIITMGVELITKLAQGLAEQAPTLVPVILDALMLVVTTLIQNAPQMLNAALTLIVSLAQGLINYLPKLIERLPEIIEALVAYLTSEGPKLVAAALTIMLQLAVGLIEAIPQLVASIPEIIVAIVKGLLDGLVDIVSVGAQFVEGLWNGISDKAQWVIDKIKGFGERILSGIKSFFGIASPSKVMAQIGEYMGEGLGLGWEDAMKDVRKDMMEDLNVDSSIAVHAKGDYSSESNGSNAEAGDGYKDLVIPIYIGDTMIDEIIINARQRVMMRSGGLQSV